MFTFRIFRQSFHKKTLFLLPAILLVVAGAVLGQVVKEDPPELREIDIIEHLGDTIDLSLQFTDDQGNKVQLGDYFKQDRPVILVLGYYECPMLCNLVFNGLSKAIQALEWKPGQEYQMLSVSIDTAEDYNLAYAKRINYLADMKEDSSSPGWVFLVSSGGQSKKLADQIGFKYFYDEERDQWAHAAAIYVLTSDGRISRYLYGIEYKPSDLRLSLLEASAGKIGNTFDRLILYCFQYDPDAKGYVVFAGNVMRLGGALTLVVLAFFLGILWVREKRNRKRIGKMTADTVKH